MAFQEIEAPVHRMWRHLAGGVVTEDDEHGRPVRLDRFWCGADAPPQDLDDFRVIRVYRTTPIPKDAVCEVCHIPIRELQATLDAALRSSSTATKG